jgi:hypothetical protein
MLLCSLPGLAFFKPSTKKLAVGSLILASVLGSKTALAADTMPFSAVDGRGHGRVVTNDPGRAGEMSVAVGVDGTSKALSESQFGGDGKQLLNERSVQTTAAFGINLTESISLGLGMRATSEKRHSASDALFADADMNKKQSDTALAGAIGQIKIGILSYDTFKLSLLTFAEAGAGKSGTASVTRSTKPKIGWMAIATTGEEGFLTFTLNGGYRYRNPETIGSITMRNEMMFGGLLRAYVTRRAGLFAGADGRRIMIADGSITEEGRSKYEPRNDAQGFGGAFVKAGDFEASIYAGSSLTKSSIGYGKASAGVSLAMVLGRAFDRKRLTDSYLGEENIKPAQEISDKELASDVENIAQDANSKNKNDAEVFVDPYGNSVYEVYKHDEKLGQPSDGDDDFMMIKDAKGPTNEELQAEREVQQELRKLREADAKVKKQEEKQRALMEKQERAREAQERKQNDALSNKYKNDVQGDVNNLPGVTDEDTSWNGLE